MPDCPQDYRYTRDHEWISLEGDIATIGITDYAQGELGDIIYVELPTVGDQLSAGDVLGTVEAVKTVAELYLPIGGEIVEVNGDLEGKPELVNESAFADGWMVRIKLADLSAVEDLMSAEDYLAMVGGQ